MNVVSRAARHARLTLRSYGARQPSFLILFVNSICNMKCEHCFYWRSLNQPTDLTLEELVAPDRELFLILGADAARNTDTWMRVERVQELATLVVVDREGAEGVPASADLWRWTHVTIPRLDISSTELRRRLETGAPLDGLVPPAVVALIRARGWYGSPA